MSRAQEAADALKGHGLEARDGGCDHCRTWMTPCLFRDGHLALDDPPIDGPGEPAQCVGCGRSPFGLQVSSA